MISFGEPSAASLPTRSVVAIAESLAESYQLLQKRERDDSPDPELEEALNRIFDAIADLERIAREPLGPIARDVLEGEPT